MTVNYGDAQSFINIVMRWRGSVWKAIAKPFLVFMVAYIVLQMAYRFVLDDANKEDFEKLVRTIDTYLPSLPLQFLVGFYVNRVLSRWESHIANLTYPDKFLYSVMMNLPGDQESTLVLRRTFARLINLQVVNCYREISIKVRRRFPTTEHIVSCGLMTKREFEVFKATNGAKGKWFIPFIWIINLIRRCLDMGIITEFGALDMMREVKSMRSEMGTLAVFDAINLPLVYVQVTKVTVYFYFALAAIGRQQILQTSPYATTYNSHLYIPVLTILELILYIGWLKVGDTLLEPLGEDDEDLNMNNVVDRNVHVCFQLADELSCQMPSIVRDVFWGDPTPELPHTLGSMKTPYPDRPGGWRFDFIHLPPEDFAIFDNRSQSRRLKSAQSAPVEPKKIDTENKA